MGLISNGTTIFDAGALDSGVAKGSMTLIKTLTASSSANLSFVNGASSVVLNNTYKEYIFKYINIHPQTDSANWLFNVSIDGGSNYNVEKTTTAYQAAHGESTSTDFTNFAYKTGFDLGEGTGYQHIGNEVANDNDLATVGSLHLFDPSSTTFIKHFLQNGNVCFPTRSVNVFHAGYANTTSAVNAVDFKFSTGNIDTGTISLYGIA